MRIPSNEVACQVLFLHAAGDGRGTVLFGENWKKTCNRVLPFVEGVRFPTLYFEFPLSGDPFLDVTVLYGEMKAGTRFHSEAAAGTERMIDWYAQVRPRHGGISFGFELDTGSDASAPAAVHFQHRKHIQLAEGFCEAIGDLAAGRLYMSLAARMPAGWAPAFFGMFRGRPGSPLRVCGYLNREERQRCAENPSCLAEVFRQTGFRAYDDGMLHRIAALLALAPHDADYQFDIYPDGRIGDTFAVDVGFGLKESEKLKSSFARGACGEVLQMLEAWGAADARWHLAAGTCLTRALPAEDENGQIKDYALTVTPQWVKARWRGGVLQNAKLYCRGSAGILREGEEEQPDR